jgi:hypothetical protein
MPGLEIEAYVRAEGPVWRRLINRKMDLASEEISKQLAEKGKELVLGHLAAVLVNPTGYYESQIDIEPVGVGYRVSDSDVIYGNWLEGTESRNKPRPGFPGYHTFQTVKDQLEEEAPRTARLVVREYLV